MIPALFPFVYAIANPNGGIGENECLPQLVPSVAANLCTFDVHVTEMVFSNQTGAAATVTVKDNQTGLYLLYATPIPANGQVAYDFRGAFMPGGINWVCGTNGAVVARVRVF
jgi:hypothetical protein